MLGAVSRLGFDVAAEHAMFMTEPKLDVLPRLLLKAHARFRGQVTLQSNDPLEPPKVDFKYFERDQNGKPTPDSDKDLQAMREGVDIVNKLIKGSHDELMLHPEIMAGVDLDSPEGIDKFVQDPAWGHHASCTCKIGGDDDPMAVNQIDLGILVEEPRHVGERPRQKKVVAVEPSHDLARDLGKPPVDRLGLAAVRAGFASRQLAPVALDDSRRAVTRSAVLYGVLQPRIALRQHALYRPPPGDAPPRARVRELGDSEELDAASGGPPLDPRRRCRRKGER